MTNRQTAEAFLRHEVYDVTNHWRHDKPFKGTVRCQVVATSHRVTLHLLEDSLFHKVIQYPPQDQIEVGEDGTIRFYGGGPRAPRDDLWLTFKPVR